MSLVIHRNGFPTISRDNFLTPFEKMFDDMFETNFPEVAQTVGVNPFSNSAYPKVNVYEYEDKVGVVAEIPGIDKKNLSSIWICLQKYMVITSKIQMIEFF